MQFIGWRRELGKGEKTEEQKNIRFCATLVMRCSNYSTSSEPQIVAIIK